MVLTEPIAVVKITIKSKLVAAGATIVWSGILVNLKQLENMVTFHFGMFQR